MNSPLQLTQNAIELTVSASIQLLDFSDRKHAIFVGFETLTPENLRRSSKRQNLGRDY